MKKILSNYSGINFYILISVIAIVLGFLATTLIINQQAVYSRTPMARKKELVKVIKETEAEREKLKKEIKSMRNTLGKIEKKAAQEEGVLSDYTSDLKLTREALGLNVVKGDGVLVSLSDNTVVPAGEDPNNYIIHDYDLRVIINALWRGGAKAVAVNSQRLIFTSAIRCAGTTILVNARRISPPYRVKAIGNPKSLLDALNSDYNSSLLINKYTKSFGLDISVTEVSGQEIPGYEGSLTVKVARASEAK